MSLPNNSSSLDPKDKIVIIGGGAAGIFAAIHAKEANPKLSVIVLEKSAVFLTKVRVSGGGRCNVTHACFDPQKLIQHYPRGSKELLGAFHRFQPKDTIDWYESRGITLKTEEDGRVFPITDRSQTIIDTLLNEARRLQIDLRIRQHVTFISYQKNLFCIQLREGEKIECKSLILATGSSPEGYQFAQSLGHTIVPPVPSLFTFNVPTSRLLNLPGISVERAVVSLPEIPMKHAGPLLITHFGFSGPAVLKLSAWAARELHAKSYQTEVQINWIPDHTLEDLKSFLRKLKMQEPTKTVGMVLFHHLPKNLWRTLIDLWAHRTLAHLSNQDLDKIAYILHADTYRMEGKTTHKEEFVTCGGVHLSEVDFRTMQSKLTPSLFITGEILNVDGVTGGFNFQNAWTTGYLAGKSAAELS